MMVGVDPKGKPAQTDPQAQQQQMQMMQQMQQQGRGRRSSENDAKGEMRRRCIWPTTGNETACSSTLLPIC